MSVVFDPWTRQSECRNDSAPRVNRGGCAEIGTASTTSPGRRHTPVATVSSITVNSDPTVSSKSTMTGRPTPDSGNDRSSSGFRIVANPLAKRSR